MQFGYIALCALKKPMKALTKFSKQSDPAKGGEKKNKERGPKSEPQAQKP
jgi:hypothetical protein